MGRWRTTRTNVTKKKKKRKEEKKKNRKQSICRWTTRYDGDEARVAVVVDSFPGTLFPV